MSQQPYDSDDGEFMFRLPVMTRMFPDCERGHIGIRSAAMPETVPVIGTVFYHPGIVPAEIEGE